MNNFSIDIPVSRIRREHLHEQIAQVIEEMIASEKLGPGDRLPSERELASKFNVNRATLRMAMRLVEQRGLVEMKVGSGIYVKNVSGSIISDAIARYVNFKSCPKTDVLSFREILEPEIAVLAAGSATAEDLERMMKFVLQIEARASSARPATYAEADTNFHEALALATHNMMIIAVISGLQKVMKKWIQTQHGLIKAHQRKALIHEGTEIHRLICDAIAARDSERAREAMKIHMRIARATLDSDGEQDSLDIHSRRLELEKTLSGQQ